MFDFGIVDVFYDPSFINEKGEYMSAIYLVDNRGKYSLMHNDETGEWVTDYDEE
jgi:hypothetical protein